PAPMATAALPTAPDLLRAAAGLIERYGWQGEHGPPALDLVSACCCAITGALPTRTQPAPLPRDLTGRQAEHLDELLSHAETALGMGVSTYTSRHAGATGTEVGWSLR